jgi:hypothetical protein
VESRCAFQGEVAPSKVAPNPLLSREETVYSLGTSILVTAHFGVGL